MERWILLLDKNEYAVFDNESEANEAYNKALKDYPYEGSTIELVKVIKSTGTRKLKPYTAGLIKRFLKDQSTGPKRKDS
ncbi:hypothetical protein [Bacillus sp. SJS]|uniref:hypothetical protein n=1 Tax=Bacillus sp. SJS TaxID=1423321 RepID=UPI0004DD6022|nr:hypothetical protein [Bacillus sp. SJS]KZZ85889.1 hypothetical protein AS29_002905 [Bacillus sp. SJS]